MKLEGLVRPQHTKFNAGDESDATALVDFHHFRFLRLQFSIDCSKMQHLSMDKFQFLLSHDEVFSNNVQDVWEPCLLSTQIWAHRS